MEVEGERKRRRKRRAGWFFFRCLEMADTFSGDSSKCCGKRGRICSPGRQFFSFFSFFFLKNKKPWEASRFFPHHPPPLFQPLAGVFEGPCFVLRATDVGMKGSLICLPGDPPDRTPQVLWPFKFNVMRTASPPGEEAGPVGIRPSALRTSVQSSPSSSPSSLESELAGIMGSSSSKEKSRSELA